MSDKAYHKLFVWQKAHNFVKEIYKITDDFPKRELFGLTSQLRRAAVSVPANIVEGHTRTSRKDFLRYLNIALGSLTECEYYLELTLELNFIREEDYLKIENLRKEVGYLLVKFIKGVRR